MQYPTDEGSYVKLTNAWRSVHPSSDARGGPIGALKIVVSLVTLLLLAPVIGMLLVFAVLPALPIALLVGTVLGPMNLFDNHEAEDEDEAWEVWEARHLAEAHAHA